MQADRKSKQDGQKPPEHKALSATETGRLVRSMRGNLSIARRTLRTMRNNLSAKEAESKDPTVKKHYNQIIAEISKLESALRIVKSSLRSIDKIIQSQLTGTELTPDELKAMLQQLKEYVGEALQKAMNVQRMVANALEKLLLSLSKESPSRAEILVVTAILENHFSKDLAQFSKSVHQEFYLPLALELDQSFREQHDKVERINKSLKKIQTSLDQIERKLYDLQMDTSGVKQLKEHFGEFLLLGTIHEKDYHDVNQKILAMIDQLNEQAPETGLICQKIRKELGAIKEDLLTWRKSSLQYYLSLAAKFGSTAITGGFSIAVPIVPAIGGALTPHFSRVTSEAISMLGEKGPPAALSAASSELASSLSSSTKDRTTVKKDVSHLAGQRHVLVKIEEGKQIGFTKPEREMSLELDGEHLWQEMLLLQMAQEWLKNNKSKLALAGLSIAIGVPLSATGLMTPLGLVLIAAGSTLGYLGIDAFNEKQMRRIEENVMKETHKRMDLIGKRFELLELGKFHQTLPNYMEYTLAFVDQTLVQLKPSRMYGFIQSLGLAQSDANTEDKIERLQKLKDKLNPDLKSENSLPHILKLLSVTNDTNSVEYIQGLVSNAKKAIAELETELVSIMGTSPLQERIKKANTELKAAESAIEKTFDDAIKDSKDHGRPIMFDQHQGFFKSDNLPKKGKDLVKALDELRNLEILYSAEKTSERKHEV